MASKYRISAPESAEELESFAEIMAASLFFPRLAQDDWTVREGHENIRLVREGEQVLGGYSVQQMGQWFGRQSIPMGAVRCVGIAPHVRHKGVATAMLKSMLQELHEAGIPIASLYPSTQPVYRKVGFEQAGVRVQYMFRTQAIQIPDRPLQVLPVDPETKEPFEALYLERCLRTQGHLDRNDWVWNVRILTPFRAKPHAYLFVDPDDGSPEGYVIYTQSFKKNIVDGELHIRDMVASTGRAARAILRFFADQRSSMQRIYWSSSHHEPLLLHLVNQDFEIEEQMRWMLRLIDVRDALQARGFPPQVEVQLHLQIQDDTLPWNDDRFVCHIRNGRAEVQRGGQGHITMDVRALAAVFSGYLSASEAQVSGMVEGDPHQLLQMDRAFAGPAPWMSDMF